MSEINGIIQELDFRIQVDWQIKQWELLKKELSRIYSNSPFYKRIWDELGFFSDESKGINSWEEFRKLPFTSKEDLQKFNDEFLCIPHAEIADFVTTSGTAGDPVWFALSDSDLERLASNEAFSYQQMGLQKGDSVQLTTTMDRRFMAGLAYFLGARKCGISTVRVGSGVPELQWDTIFKVQPKALVCVPSFLLKMLEYAEEKGLDFKNSSVRRVLCIGEPIRNQDFSANTLAKRILDKWDVQLYSTYASTEMASAFTECCYGQGGHLQPELLVIEIVDEDGNLVSEGGSGELVITTLGIEGMPLVRFKTGDILQSFHGICACGSSTPRLGPVIGRKNQMIKYKGTTLYPPAMFDLLHDFEQIDNYIVQIDTNDLGEDEILVKIGVKNFETRMQDKEAMQNLVSLVKDRFRAKLRVSPCIHFAVFEEVQKLKFPENSRKSVGIIDNR